MPKRPLDSNKHRRKHKQGTTEQTDGGPVTNSSQSPFKKRRLTGGGVSTSASNPNKHSAEIGYADMVNSIATTYINHRNVDIAEGQIPPTKEQKVSWIVGCMRVLHGPAINYIASGCARCNSLCLVDGDFVHMLNTRFKQPFFLPDY
jgi:hypothetical protein